MSEARIRVSEAAALLGVSDDTIRRWADSGRLRLDRVDGGPSTIAGAEVAALALELGAAADPADSFATARTSARNRLTGIVTRVVRDGVMAQVELQAGPFRVVSLISREAADDLGLEPGSIAVARIKATNVEVDLPAGAER